MGYSFVDLPEASSAEQTDILAIYDVSSDTLKQIAIEDLPIDTNGSIFTGTTHEWEILPAAQKATYTYVNLTDDFNGASIDAVPTQSSTHAVQSGGTYTAIQNVATEAKCVILSTGSTTVSSLPYTFSNAAITTDMVCLKMILSNPSAQSNEWTVNTDTAGQAIVSGTISGSTTITLYMLKARTV